MLPFENGREQGLYRYLNRVVLHISRGWIGCVETMVGTEYLSTPTGTIKTKTQLTRSSQLLSADYITDGKVSNSDIFLRRLA
jgi:hypothetical protein